MTTSSFRELVAFLYKHYPYSTTQSALVQAVKDIYRIPKDDSTEKV